jgi:NAD(P)-dependent dehydrogenase (short-subunit alcohol dehydrogenase family)
MPVAWGIAPSERRIVIAKRAKRIVLTGVSRGLGLALAERFVELGHQINGCARSKTTIAALRKRFGPPHRFTALSVTDDAAVRRWARATIRAQQGVDLLINNAGVMGRKAPLWDVTAREFADVVDVNLTGVANVIRHFAPPMVRRCSGVIVNFSSGRGRKAGAQVAPYSATKWAIEGLTQALAQELPKGMAAVALNPGYINTEMLRISFGPAAHSFPSADRWSRTAATFILQIGAADNGLPLTVPDSNT